MNKLCKYMSNPGPVHWQALKHLLRYLRGTLTLGLKYDFGQPAPVPGVHGYTDSSYADCPDTSRSTIGYVFFYGGAILSWYSKLHTFVTTCTNHSEYAALAAGAKEAQWFVYCAHTPVPLFVDNSGIVSMVFNPVDHQSNKHIRVSCHFARELTEEKVIAPQPTRTWPTCSPSPSALLPSARSSRTMSTCPALKMPIVCPACKMPKTCPKTIPRSRHMFEGGCWPSSHMSPCLPSYCSIVCSQPSPASKNDFRQFSLSKPNSFSVRIALPRSGV